MKTAAKLFVSEIDVQSDPRNQWMTLETVRGNEWERGAGSAAKVAALMWHDSVTAASEKQKQKKPHDIQWGGESK